MTNDKNQLIVKNSEITKRSEEDGFSHILEAFNNFQC